MRHLKLNRWSVFFVSAVIVIGLTCISLESRGELSTEAAVNSGEQQKALEILMLLAYEGDAQSQYELAILFTEGVGMMADFKEAFFWFSRSAEQGHVDAQYRVGSAYLNGKGVDPDRQKGLEWWRKAAEGGSLPALYHLGRAYLYGVGVEPDPEEAKSLLQSAADTGSKQAAMLLRQIDATGNQGQEPSLPDMVRTGNEAVWIYASFNRLSPMIEQLPPGSRLRVKERRGGWYRVELPDGLPLWIGVEHALVGPKGLFAIIKDEDVEARSEPSNSVDSPVLGWLRAGEEVSIVTTRGDWLRVRVPDRHLAWVEALAILEGNNTALPITTHIPSGIEDVSLLEDKAEKARSADTDIPTRSNDGEEDQMLEARELTNGRVFSANGMPDSELRAGPLIEKSDRISQTLEEGLDVSQAAVTDPRSVGGQETELASLATLGTGMPPVQVVLQIEDTVNTQSGTEGEQDSAAKDVEKGTVAISVIDSGQKESVSLVRNDYGWLFRQDKAALTIELMSVTSEVLVRRFVQESGFRDYVTYFTLSEGSRIWYVVLHGSYQELIEVRRALDDLPIKLDALRIRRFGALQNRLCGAFDDLPVPELELLEFHCASGNG